MQTYMDLVVNLVVILIVVSSVVSACFTVLLRTGVNPATIELAELVSERPSLASPSRPFLVLLRACFGFGPL